jgi:hypothetical protein
MAGVQGKITKNGTSVYPDGSVVPEGGKQRRSVVPLMPMSFFEPNAGLRTTRLFQSLPPLTPLKDLESKTSPLITFFKTTTCLAAYCQFASTGNSFPACALRTSLHAAIVVPYTFSSSKMFLTRYIINTILTRTPTSRGCHPLPGCLHSDQLPIPMGTSSQ